MVFIVRGLRHLAGEAESGGGIAVPGAGDFLALRVVGFGVVGGGAGRQAEHAARLLPEVEKGK